MDNKIQDADTFIDYCFTHFGSMNKNDYEVELMHLYLMKNAKMRDNEISRNLKIPITKVRRLLYEVDLRYPRETEEYKEAFYQCLCKCTYKRDGRLLQFSIPNKALREYLSDILEEAGSYFDSSFNSSIVRITALDLILILSIFNNNKDLEKEIKKKLEKNDKKLPETVKKKVKNVLTPLGKTIGVTFVDHLIEMLMDYYEDRVTESQ